MSHSGTNGMFGPPQDVSRLFSTFNESRLVDASGRYFFEASVTPLIHDLQLGSGLYLAIAKMS